MKQRLLGTLCLLALLTAALLGAVGCGEEPTEGFDYRTEELSSYISIDASKYTDRTVTIKYDAVTEADVDDWICRILVSHRADKPSNDGAGISDEPITLGDEVSIYYRGYYFDDKGERVYFSGGNNTNATATKITVGKMDYVSGFETSLLGLVPAEMTTLKNSGRIAQGDYITASYFVLYPDKTYERTTAVIPFAEENRDTIDARFGEGFYEMLASEDNALEYGLSNDKAYISSAQFDYASDEHGTGKISYQDLVLLYGTSAEAPAVVAETYFPASYSKDPSLQCKTVYFDIYLDAATPWAVKYETPVLDDTFILEQEEISLEEILSHEGDTLVEQYRSVVRSLLRGNAEAASLEYKVILYDALFEYLIEATEVTSYPEEALKSIREVMQAELDAVFASQGSTYGYTDKEAFAKVYFGYTSGTSAEYIESVAKDTVHSRLAFYGVAKKENVLPTEAERKAAAEELKQTYFAINVAESDELDRDKFDSDAAYEAALDDFFDEMMEYYGEEYFLEEAEYYLVMERLAEGLTVNNLGRTE